MTLGSAGLTARATFHRASFLAQTAEKQAVKGAVGNRPKSSNNLRRVRIGPSAAWPMTFLSPKNSPVDSSRGLWMSHSFSTTSMPRSLSQAFSCLREAVQPRT